MAALRALGVAALAMLVLYVAFDAGATPAAPGTTPALLGMAVLFGVGAWAFGVGGRAERSPAMAGLAAGLALYAALRVFLLG